MFANSDVFYDVVTFVMINLKCPLVWNKLCSLTFSHIYPQFIDLRVSLCISGGKYWQIPLSLSNRILPFFQIPWRIITSVTEKAEIKTVITVKTVKTVSNHSNSVYWLFLLFFQVNTWTLCASEPPNPASNPSDQSLSKHAGFRTFALNQ